MPFVYHPHLHIFIAMSFNTIVIIVLTFYWPFICQSISRKPCSTKKLKTIHINPSSVNFAKNMAMCETTPIAIFTKIRVELGKINRALFLKHRILLIQVP